MDIHDFEAWVARRDPQWYLQPIDAVFGMVAAYKEEEGLQGGEFPRYALAADMQAAQTQAKKPQLNLF